LITGTGSKPRFILLGLLISILLSFGGIAYYQYEKNIMAVFIAIFIVILLFITFLAGFVYRSHQRNYYKELFIKEKDLRTAQQEFKTTLYSIGEAIITVTTTGKIKHMNPIAEILTGWKENESIGRPLEEVFQIINEVTKERAENPVRKVLKNGIVTGLTNHTLLISREGRKIPISESGAPIKNENGEIYGAVLVFSDVTKEYIIFKNLEKSERFLKESQLAGRIGSYMTDLIANIWASSEALDIIFGIDKNYNKSTTGWVSIVHPDWQQELSDYLVNEVLGKKQRFDKEYLIVRKNDGEERWVHGVGELEFDDEGTPIKMIGTIQDITERVKASKELELYKNHLEELIAARTSDLDKVNAQLLGEIQKAKEYEMMLQTSLKNEQTLNEFKSRFISTTSHEFRTPLTSILSSSELLKRYGTKWEQKKIDEHLDRIKYSVDHLTKLLDDVLTINRTDNGKINYNPQLIDLRALCDEIILEAGSHSNNSHNFIFRYKTEKNNFILDRKLIRFILLNLLSNAFKYSPDGGDIVLEISTDENNLKFRIEDSGIGIPEEDRKHLFEPFHRGNNVNAIPGTGLGLSIVKKSVEIHSGQIKYNSVLGQGTNFTITIPGDINEQENINN
jgi:PAS domain S-box-containing protein